MTQIMHELYPSIKPQSEHPRHRPPVPCDRRFIFRLDEMKVPDDIILVVLIRDREMRRCGRYKKPGNSSLTGFLASREGENKSLTPP